ncbi:MAG: hypothetical protein M3Y35_00570 [Actinomycetota bacterium]|nr:hypothetical protein [Actinomycetota bacterium]
MHRPHDLRLLPDLGPDPAWRRKFTESGHERTRLTVLFQKKSRTQREREMLRDW